jgi:hypothetical protein
VAIELIRSAAGRPSLARPLSLGGGGLKHGDGSSPKRSLWRSRRWIQWDCWRWGRRQTNTVPK